MCVEDNGLLRQVSSNALGEVFHWGISEDGVNRQNLIDIQRKVGWGENIFQSFDYVRNVQIRRLLAKIGKYSSCRVNVRVQITKTRGNAYSAAPGAPRRRGTAGV